MNISLEDGDVLFYYEENEDDLVCGCCFGSTEIAEIIQCPEGHLFCKGCVIGYSSVLLGDWNYRIVCMDKSGCKLSFSDDQLQRSLSPALIHLYERIKRVEEVRMAGLEGIEECPRCEFMIVIENPDERLFRCLKEECGAVTCRKCKHTEHLPQSCKEAAKERKVDEYHVIEEAMSSALVRKCPKCERAFIKESGCNRISCATPGCQTFSCYVCRQVLPDNNGEDYKHFDPSDGKCPSKCRLWDPKGNTKAVHKKEVKEALKAAKAKQEAEKSLDLERIARSKGKAKAKEKDVEAGGEGSHQKERNSKRHQVHLKLQKLLTIRRRSHQSVPAVAP